jgi:cholesterol oxidase
MGVRRTGMDYDFVIVGSGFGGSVSALRLAEKGYKVAVIEQGQWVTPADMEQAADDIKKLNWLPALGMTGFFFTDFYRHVSVAGGVGVGGGSLVYAAVLLKPKAEFYTDPAWSRLGVDWKKELQPHYETASRMLGVTENPSLGIQDNYLQQTAEEMGAGSTFCPTPNGIYFGTPEVMQDDPYFHGIGPSRTGCHLCGECLTGCVHGSKNSLDKNYLYLAQRLGATILPNRKVADITPLEHGDYIITMRHPVKSRQRYPAIRGHKVIIAAGVLGTLELMFRCRDVTKSLPAISPQLGRLVRTNSEAIVGVLSPDSELDLTRGTAISSHFYPDTHTHITQNRFPKGYTYMKWLMGPLVDNPSPLKRSLGIIKAYVTHPLTSTSSWRARNWHQRITVLTVMQHLDNQLAFKYGRSLSSPFRRRLKSVKVPGKQAPTYLPVANNAARILARKTGGTPLNVLMESVLNLSTTAHILGGCHMGSSPESAVIDSSHQVFGYPGLYVMNGASVSANIGANPSLTIAAMTERAVSLIPPRDGSKAKTS